MQLIHRKHTGNEPLAAHTDTVLRVRCAGNTSVVTFLKKDILLASAQESKVGV